LISDLEERYQKLRSECDNITKDLQHALAMRELCNADFNRVKRWLQEAEVQLTPESSAGTIAELEMQLKEQWIDSDQPVYFSLVKHVHPFFVVFHR
jgi:chromosome segregation ATPase